MQILSFLEDKSAVLHFSGILGEGMLPLARLMKEQGYTVKGSDRDMSRIDRAKGTEITVSTPSVDNIISADLVIYTLALDKDDMELFEAKKRGIPAVSRAQLLGALMLMYRTSVAVSGSHGKSTTTALIDHIMSEAGRTPTTVCGARLPIGDNCRSGGQSLMIAESCEYKDSFLELSPSVQVVTSLELDHTDYFPDFDAIYRSFAECVGHADRAVVLNCDTESTASLARFASVPCFTYGFSSDAFYRCESVGCKDGVTTLKIEVKNGASLELETSLIGEYNILNITAAFAVADILGVEHGVILRAVSTFHGIDGRFSYIGIHGGRRFFSDYAHHPTEIASVISAARAAYGAVTVVFRPHTYSRTKSLWSDFLTALGKADFTILTDIYPAREAAIEGVDSKSLADELCGNAEYVPLCELAQFVLERTFGTVILMGAGDLSALKAEIAARIEADGECGCQQGRGNESELD